jgi:hypothetical protein
MKSKAYDEVEKSKQEVLLQELVRFYEVKGKDLLILSS